MNPSSPATNCETSVEKSSQVSSLRMELCRECETGETLFDLKSSTGKIVNTRKAESRIFREQGIMTVFNPGRTARWARIKCGAKEPAPTITRVLEFSLDKNLEAKAEMQEGREGERDQDGMRRREEEGVVSWEWRTGDWMTVERVEWRWRMREACVRRRRRVAVEMKTAAAAEGGLNLSPLIAITK
nr:hypothetical protein Iba_chr05bCG12150 [Ipomoea batatas]